MKREVKRPITVEDLLRLKRAERPAEDFWVEFDRQLRAKQLAALVEKRPWWREISLAGVFAGFRRYHLPLGATAIVALSFVSYRVSQTAPESVALTPAAGVAVREDSALPADPVAGRTASAKVDVTVVAPAGPLAPAEVAAPRQEAASGRAAAGTVAASSLAFTSGPVAEEPSLLHPVTGVRASDGGWASGSVVEPVLSRSLLATTTRFEARVSPTRQVVEPLRQITPPAERRGARILTAMVSMASVENAMRTTERAASRLSEEELYEQIRRVGAFGAGVNVKF